MEIVQVTENYWEELKVIRLASLKESLHTFAVSYEAALTYSEAEWKTRASGNSGCNFFIAKMDSLSVGIIGGFHRNDAYELISMWVSPSQRGKGIAKMLVNKIIQHAKELGRDSIFLEVMSNNIPASKLYEKFGFSLVSTRVSSENGVAKVLNKLELNL